MHVASSKLLRVLQWSARAGLYGAVVAGVVEYLVTDGVSGWVPLLAGLAGAIASPLMLYVERGTADTLRSAKERLGWKHAFFSLAGVFCIYVFISQWEMVRSVGEWLARQRPSMDHLLTRPLCASGDCPNFAFQVLDCERLAVQTGGLAMPPRDPDRPRPRSVPPNRERATSYFRGCLVDRGLAWSPCERGEPECRLLYAFYGSALPSFVVD